MNIKKKKKVFTKIGTLFSPNSSGHLRSDAHYSQIIGGDADVDHTQTIGGVQSNYLGGIYPPGFWHSNLYVSITGYLMSYRVLDCPQGFQLICFFLVRGKTMIDIRFSYYF